MNNPQAIAQGLQQFQLARALRDQGDLAGAAGAFARASALIPNHLPMLVEYARLAEQAGDWSASEKIYRRIGDIKHDSHFEGFLAVALFRQQEYDEAIPFFRAHLAREPHNVELLRGLGASLAKLYRWEEALACGLELEALAPGEQAMDIVLNSLFYLGRGDELDCRVDEAMRLYPDRPGTLAVCGTHLLKRQQFARGFALQRAIRWGYDSRPPASLAQGPEDWDGAPFDGILLVAGEQGLGEEILASRFFPALVRLGQRAIIECEPRLLPIFRRSFPSFEFLPRWEGHLERIAASGIHFRRVKSLDLACFFHAELQGAPPAGWLLPDNDKVDELRHRYQAAWPGERLIGISWDSSRVIHGSRGKAAPVEALAPVLQMPGVAAISVQYGDTRDALASLRMHGLPQPFLDTAIDAEKDLDGLLAQLCALDALVTVSNSTAHIAGAAGVPTHLMLPNAYPVFWYWGYTGEKTPWYPSIRLWRNDPGNDWRALATRVAATLTTEPR